MEVLRGRIVQFKYTASSEFGYLKIREYETGIIFHIPCEKYATAQALNRFFGAEIDVTNSICETYGHTFQDVLWSRNPESGLLAEFFPIDQATDEIIDSYYMGCFKDEPGHETDLSNVEGTGERIADYRQQHEGGAR